MNRQNKGFTLVELVMVLFIITLVLGGILVPLSAKLEQEERKQVQQLLQEARNSIIGYALVNGYLPCPDCPNNGISANCGTVSTSADAAVNDGLEDLIRLDDGVATSDRAAKPPNICATPEGNLPWATLGLSEFDAWANHFRYRVTDDFSDDDEATGTACGTAATGVSFQICSTGDINVVDEAGGTVAAAVPAIVVSFGKNANDAGNPSSTSEAENQDVDTEFVQKDYATEDGTDEFDDLMIWIPTNVLIYRMVQAERLP